jgi:hypothetical protein
MLRHLSVHLWTQDHAFLSSGFIARAYKHGGMHASIHRNVQHVCRNKDIIARPHHVAMLELIASPQPRAMSPSLSDRRAQRRVGFGPLRRQKFQTAKETLSRRHQGAGLKTLKPREATHCHSEIQPRRAAVALKPLDACRRLPSSTSAARPSSPKTPSAFATPLIAGICSTWLRLTGARPIRWRTKLLLAIERRCRSW